jgi:protein kinase C substrate 80K-H
MDRAESLSATALEFKKQSRKRNNINLVYFSTCLPALYQSLLTHHHALKSLRKAHLSHLEREDQLGNILETLKGGYNPNYQDMAVLEAVRGWEALSGEKKEDSSDSTDEPELEEGEWTELQLEHELEDVINQDHVSLLHGHESHLNQNSVSLRSWSSILLSPY